MTKSDEKILDEKFKNIHLTIENGFEKIQTNFDRIIEHNEWQNSKIATTIEKVKDNTDYRKSLQSNYIIKQIVKRPIPLIIAGFVLILVILGFLSVDQILDIKKFF